MSVKYLPVTLTLGAAAAFPVGPRHGNSAVSAPYVPGRVQRGAVSAALGAIGSGDHDRIVLSGDVCFGPAWPLAGSADEPVEDWSAFLPTPACLRVDRVSGEVHDLSHPAAAVGPGLERPSEVVSADLVSWARLEREAIVRTPRQRRRGRPVEGAGGPFFTVALADEQSFRAYWRLRAEDEAQVEDLAYRVYETFETIAASAAGLRLGRAADSAFGHDVTVEPHVDMLTDRPGPALRAMSADEVVWLVLLSPALVTDPATGEYDPAALTAEIGRRIAGYAEPVGEGWVRATLLGGYHRRWHGYLPQRWAAAAGSVVRCRITHPQGVSEQTQANWLRDPAGDDWEDGYGQLIVLPAWDTPVRPQLAEQPVRRREAAQQNPVESGRHPQDAVTLAIVERTLVWRELSIRLDQVSIEWVAASGLPVSPSLLGRLRAPLHAPEDVRRPEVATMRLQALSHTLAGLATPARKALRVRLRAPDGSGESLLSWLQRTCAEPSTLFGSDAHDRPSVPDLARHIADYVVAVGTEPDEPSTAAARWLERNAAPVAVHFLDALLRRAARETR